LAALIQILCCIFAEESPVYSKQLGYNPPPQPAFQQQQYGMQYPSNTPSTTPYPTGNQQRMQTRMPMPMPGMGIAHFTVNINIIKITY
jgi:hypothetical protein